MAQVQYIGTGRRKNAVARVRLVPGTGKITVNKKDVEEYIPHADLREVINQPFAVTETKGAYDVFVNVNGGGYAGQSGAIRHGIARALLEVDPDFRLALKRAGLLTRDARMVERKKPGLKKARKASQFSKRELRLSFEFTSYENRTGRSNAERSYLNPNFSGTFHNLESAFFVFLAMLIGRILGL